MATKKEEKTKETESNPVVDKMIADRIQIITERNQLQQQLSNLFQQKADIETNIRALESQRDEGTGMLRYINTKLTELGFDLEALNAQMQQGPQAPETAKGEITEEGEETG